MNGGSHMPRLIRLALIAFPRVFRDAHAAEMEEDYAEAHSACGTWLARVSLTVRTAADLVVSGLRERRAVRDRSRPDDRKALGSGLLEDLGFDARYALRAMRRSPTYAVAAVATLGLGIGANTAVFSVVDAVLLRPLPYASPERLVLAGTVTRGEPAPAAPFARYAEYNAWKDDSQSLVAVGAYTSAPFRVTGGEEPVLARTLVIDAGLLPVLGVSPLIGAGFTPDLDVPGGPRVVLLSHDHWQSNFGGDPDIVGATIELNGQAHEVRGVLPPDFDFPPPTRQADGWSSIEPALYVSRRAISSEIGNYPWWVVGRLADGVTAEQAARELGALRDAFSSPPLPGEGARDVHVVPLHEAVVGPLRPALLAFLSSVALVLLITCVNLGAVMLARLSARRHEFAVRLALGAGRWRVTRQLATEGLLVTGLGGAAGVGIAAIGLRTLLAAAPQDLPGLADARLNLQVLAFASAVTAAAGVMAGGLQAVSAGRIGGRFTWGARGGVSERATRRTHDALVVAEVSLAAALLVAAGLLIRSFGALAGVDPGFRDENMLTVDASVPADRYPQRADIVAYYDAVERRVAALPGVVAVGAVDRLPFGRSSSRIRVSGAAGQETDASAAPAALNLTARAGYFEAMGIPLVQGRVFDTRDGLDAQPAVVISRSLARRLGPEGGVLGRHVRAFGATLEIVGVVGDVRHFGPAVPPQPMIYFTQATDPVLRRGMTLVVRTRSSPEALAPLVRSEVRAVDGLVPISEARSFSALRADKVAGERFNAVLVGVFGALAVVLVGVGIYGVMAFAIVHRRREIGVRLAVGASSAGVLASVLGHAARLVVVGLAIGLLASLPVVRLLRGLLFGVEPLDPVSFVTAAAVMLLVGVLAALVPARQAAAVEPLVALREE